MSQDEIFPLVDNDGNVIGKATRRECHGGSMLLHPVVHLHVVIPGQGVYLQQRNHDKDIQPDKWDTSVGGHVDYGESIAMALSRESREELGLNIDEMEVVALQPYVFQSDRERELINPFIGIISSDTDPKPDPSEIQDGRFWSFDEIHEAIGTGVLTPNFEQEFVRIEQFLRQKV